MVVKDKPALMIVMGVSGCGKSTIAAQLADALDATYLDADDHHPHENVAKMSRGEALDDVDRWPWLQHFGKVMAEQGGQCVGACSALKRNYRECLTEAAAQPVLFIFLKGSRKLLSQRINARSDHFMPPALLDSQLSTLEMPDADECVITVDISGTPDQVVAQVLEQLGKLDSC